MLVLSLLLPVLLHVTVALRYGPQHVGFNLNENQTAVDPLDYWGAWEDHEYMPSPVNWRFPFYTLFLDRFVNGDPSNDNANGTLFEHDPRSNQLRYGGDMRGLRESLDYLHGMGIRGLYLAGSPHINMPWAADGYSPLDLTLLDAHFGNIDDWRETISEVHRRGMMGDLIGFEGYLNTSTPFDYDEHDAVWKSDRIYHDFQINNERSGHCEYPRFWTETGQRVGKNVTERFVSCRESDFDQYGEVAAFGNYPEYQRQLSKFAFVQDRLREWRSDVLAKIQRFSCITIAMLDIDGFRIDKALTITLDAQAEWSHYIRNCASELGKDNFFIPGEIVSGNTLAALYLGRGKEPGTEYDSVKDAVTASNETTSSVVIRDGEKSALDGVAFHYSVYRALTRFLGLERIDGVFAAELDTPINWVDGWNTILRSNDLVNANTGRFDPRHMLGVTNHDTFRWSSIVNGTEKMLLGLFITTLHLPGIPLLSWGEEQAFYVLESTAGNYVFGRSPMSSAQAWQLHGCYHVGTEKYFNFPLESALGGCGDDSISLDHRDPSHPVRNIIKRMYELRERFPSLNDGYHLQQLSNQTYDIYLPGSNGTATETGMWSTVRSHFDGVQDFTGQGQGNQSVWLVYQNDNRTIRYQSNCSDEKLALVAPFSQGVTVKNLFYPYDEYLLGSSPKKLGFEGSTEFNGCVPEMEIPAWGFKAFVPKEKWVKPSPTITKFLPGHDHRIRSTGASGNQTQIPIEIHFSAEINCEDLLRNIQINSTTQDDGEARIDTSSVRCRNVPVIQDAKFAASVPTSWSFTANLVDVSDGVHRVTVRNVSTEDQTASTNAVDHFLLRVGREDNPMVFPKTADYSPDLLHRNDDDGSLWVSHKAVGADKFRYSLDWGSTYSDWEEYTGRETTLVRKKVWSGTKRQSWDGEHVIMEYWSQMTGSSDHIQHADLDRDNRHRRRFPHLFLHGPFNQYGFDAGLPNEMKQNSTGYWTFDFMTEWPTNFHLNVWGINPDNLPDQTFVFGDVNNDSIIDRIPPISLLENVINITGTPPSPFLAYRLVLDDAAYRYELRPIGSRWYQLGLYLLLAVIPMLSGIAATWAFVQSFYQVKFNKIGIEDKKGMIPMAIRRKFQHHRLPSSTIFGSFKGLWRTPVEEPANAAALAMDAGSENRRTVLIATMEYDIEDWGIKIKIGGLGVMAQLMGKNLGHQDLIWVVPCVGGIDYPFDDCCPGAPMLIKILDKDYVVQVQYHTLRNITYVLLDAPVFRQQSKNEPYPARMDDLDSAIYYSAWNSCIAEAIKRFPVDLYHINDYHGAIAPLHLLPRTIPCCLSLHNAEFQGLWPMRTPSERNEVCRVFNLDPAIAQRFVQFGEVFNLLHAGASYLRIYQKGFGAVGVSKKYGKRSYARYPIFWGLKEVGALPNPDPSDTGELNQETPKDVHADPEFEAERAGFRRQAQEWAGLDQNPAADLFVFVGRWSMQKGVDLIADVFPSILESHPQVQLICIGPVIDLYGKWAALKLEKMMELYPGRVFSKPEFTALPPYIFSGAEYALIPSRDEPFGLVAVEFGRKGALGVGARVGGLGQMPGWWFTIESTTTKHLMHQFKTAIHEALASKPETRALMRARSSLQRFPVAQWVQDLEILQSTAIKVHQKQVSRTGGSIQIPSIQIPSIQTQAVGIAVSGSEPGLDYMSRSVSPQYAQNSLSPGSGLQPPGLLSPNSSPIMSQTGTPSNEDPLLTPAIPNLPWQSPLASRSALSLGSVVGDKKDFSLQKVDPFFTDSSGEYARAFKQKLENLDGKTSEDQLCIEEQLVKSEKKFFNRFHDVKMGRSQPSTPALSIYRRPASGSAFSLTEDMEGHGGVSHEGSVVDEFLLGEDYVAPSGLKKLLQLRIFDWPVYSFLLALGQIIAANSYQITLLTGEVGQSAVKLYVIASIYLVTSIMWWLVFRSLKSIYVLSVPFFFYGSAFFLIGMTPYIGSISGRGWLQNIATSLG
ncbi:MAG: hypothetical protein M1816_005556 [Peltula sp. TS41687]|nr:MAG: hypothetical protein M1816_005556 [Peltula sp. TS41687]